MEILRAAIQRIGKAGNAQNEEVSVPDFENIVLQNKTDLLNDFVSNMRSVFNSSGHAVFGKFDENISEFPFSTYLEDFWKKQDDSAFVVFCKNSSKRLFCIVRKIFSAKVDYVIFVQYREQGADFLFIVLLNNVNSALVGDDGQLTSAPTLDIHKLHHASRINLSKWLENARHLTKDNYLSFISKLENKTTGAGYFREFIGGAEYSDADATTRALKTATKNFARDNSLSVEDVMKEAFSFLSHNIKNDIELETFAHRIFPEYSNEFIKFAHSFEIPGHFQPSYKEVKKFQRLSIRTSDYSINLARNLFGDSVNWDSHKHILHIKVSAEDGRKIDAFMNE